MKLTVAYGFDRRAEVPALPDTTPRVCIQCDHWFAARPRFRRCDGCQPQLARRGAQIDSKGLTGKTHTAVAGSSDGASQGQVRATKNQLLPALIKHIQRHYSAFQLEHDLDGVLSLAESDSDWFAILAVARERATALKVRAKLKVPPKPSFTGARFVRASGPFVAGITRRNVALGLQDPRDLKVYAR